jgi:hypothetical protein
MIICIVWMLIAVMIDHRGAFPLIDDWAYAHGVSGLLFDGVLKISDWVAMTQISHLFMGYGWSLVFGYSLEHLREMTLVISFLGSFGMYGLTGYFTSDWRLRLVGTLVVVVNPIWLYLSHTFMTDIPFTVLFLILIWAIVRSTERYRVRSAMQRIEGESGLNGWRWTLSGMLILAGSVVLVLMRQTGLGLGFSFLLWVLLMSKDMRRRFFVPALVLVGVQVLALVGYEWGMGSADALSTRYHGASSLGWILDRPWWLVRAGYYVLIQLQYVGMFLLPLLPFVWWRWRVDGWRGFSHWAYVAAGVVVLGVGVAVGGDILMNPRYTHLMQYDTVGHVMTIDFTYERLEFSRNLYPLWVVLHALGMLHLFLLMVLGSASWTTRSVHDSDNERSTTIHEQPHARSLVADFVRRLRALWQQGAAGFDAPVVWMLLILAGYTVFISIGQFVFDRYVMLQLPLAVLVTLSVLHTELGKRRETNGSIGSTRPPLAAESADQQGANIPRAWGDRSIENRVIAVSVVFLSLSFLFATIGTHDSFEWNRVRFGAIEALEAQGISPHQIDGGAEYNSWKRTGPLQPLRLNEKSWWYVDDDTYAIAHEEIPGYERISVHPFVKYYGLKRDSLYVIRRVETNHTVELNPNMGQ